MPIYEITITKQLTANNLFRWNNVWHDNVETFPDAITDGEALVDFETAVHSANVTLVNLRVRQLLPVGLATNRPLSQEGTFDATGDQMPVFLAVRADLIPDFGRAGRKYFHALLGEVQQSAGIIANDYQTAFAAAATTLFGTFTGNLCTADGFPMYYALVLKENLTEHQFKRKWARRGGTP